MLRRIRDSGLLNWIGPYWAARHWRGMPKPNDVVHAIICIADHFEPRHGKASAEQAQARVRDWVDNYPKLFGEFRDSDGRPPRYSFFYPLEEYDERELDALATLCRHGFGEVEVHLHHDNDNGERLRDTLLAYKNLIHARHGFLPVDPRTKEIRYGFIHGNWALDNSRPDGRWCGVNNELDVLRETGCYADFTLPSAPSATQTAIINSIYYAVDDPRRPKSHDCGVEAAVGSEPPPDSLLLIQGPLLLDWRRRKWGIVPRVENGCLQSNQPLQESRLDLWLRARVQVQGRPDWFFIKLHTHGAPEANRRTLLGSTTVEFHRALAARVRADPDFHVHYVTAREMFNLVKAAESGWTGTISDGRDFVLPPP